MKAYDWVGNQGSSVKVSFTVDTETPMLSITNPKNETIMEKSKITVEWSGNDTGSGIKQYQINIDKAKWENVTKTSYTLKELSDGYHTVKVKAIDEMGNIKTKSVKFTVNTSPIGGPGMMEELIIGISVGGGSAAVTIVLYFKKWKQE